MSAYKLIYFNVNGINGFKDSELTIDFALQKLVRRSNVPNEVSEILPDLFMFNVHCITGFSASGKTSVVNALNMLNSFITKDVSIEKSYLFQDEINYELIYLINDEIVKFSGKLKLVNGIYEMVSQNVYVKKYFKSYYINDYLYEFSIEDLSTRNFFKKTTCKEIDNELLLKDVITKVDKSIEDIIFKKDKVLIKYFNREWINIKHQEIEKYLSTTTYNTFKLLSKIFSYIKNNELLIIDDIDVGLNIIIVEQVLDVLTNSKLNYNNTSLIFTTSNTMLLDYFSRIDCMFYVENNKEIIINNLSSYIDRNDIKKSKFIYEKYEDINKKQIKDVISKEVYV